MSASHLEAAPQIAIVRVLTPGGPYAPNDVLSVAFTAPDVGRLRCHDGRAFVPPADGALVPEVVSAVVLWESEPFGAGQVLTLSFVDPSFARIHAVGGAASDRERRAVAPELDSSSSNGRSVPFVEPHTVAVATRAAPPHLAHPELPAPAAGSGVTLRLRWSADRVRRFVQVCDKLFTVERLGWYRHSLVLRLLVPDEVSCADTIAQGEAQQHLATLRAAVAETLGNPLLAAFMPNFSVTPAWLQSLETSEVARALASFRGLIAPHLPDAAPAKPWTSENLEETLGFLTRKELLETPFAIEAGLALLIPHASAAGELSQSLGIYRAQLGELFGQMAETPEKTRLTTMTQPNHVLDDQLWQLVSAIARTFEPAPAA